MTTILLVNPAAGRGRAARAAMETERAIAAAWGPVHRIDTTAPGSAIPQVRQAVEAGAERVVVLGGDGTLHEAVNGLLRAAVDPRPPVAIVPAGTGNDYAKMARTIGLAPTEAIRRLARGEIRRFDVGVAEGEYFINSVGIGFDAEVARVVSRWKWARGLPAYLAAVLQVLARFEPVNVEVSADDAVFTDRLLLLEIAIGPCVGGGFRLTPAARPDDGWLDLCAIRNVSVPGVLIRLPLVMFGKHTRLRQVRMLRATTVLVQPRAGALHAQFDGELREVKGPFHIRLEPGALPVIIAQ